MLVVHAKCTAQLHAIAVHVACEMSGRGNWWVRHAVNEKAVSMQR